ncbi:MAG: prephenate dehydrogenase, partial [Myxococcota bacterium]
IAPGLRAGTLVTDVGSVKEPLAETLPGLLLPESYYVGSHPMAGSHRRGFEFADPNLFEDAPCVVLESGAPEPEARLCAFWQGLGGRVVRLDARTHDAQVGWVSHLPHLLAFAFGDALGSAPADVQEVAGPGFRDFTRLARSEPAMWADILSANRKALGGPVQQAIRALGELSRIIEAGDSQALEEGLLRARQNLNPSPTVNSCRAESDARPSQRQGSTPDGDPKTTHD